MLVSTCTVLVVKGQGFYFTLTFVWFPNDNSITVLHKMIILITRVDNDPTMVSIDFRVKRSRSKSNFFRTIIQLSFDIKWYFNHSHDNSISFLRFCTVFVWFHLCIVCRLGMFVIRLRQIFSLSLYIHWWYFIHVLPMNGRRPQLILGSTTSFDFRIYRSKVKFVLWSLHDFRMIPPSPFDIKWWYFWWHGCCG